MPSSSMSVVDEALDAMSAEQLRELVRAMLPWVDAATRARLMNQVVDRAARGGSEWAPSAPRASDVARIEAFAAAAVRAAHAEPASFDEHLREGNHAFLARDYAAAHRVFAALLVPLANGRVYLGGSESGRGSGPSRSPRRCARCGIAPRPTSPRSFSATPSSTRSIEGWSSEMRSA